MREKREKEKQIYQVDLDGRLNDELSGIISRQFSSSNNDKLGEAKRLLSQNKGLNELQLTTFARLVYSDDPSSFRHDYVLYTAATPNGFKVSMLLEELEVPYDVVFVSFQQEEQKRESYLKLNPNGRIPTVLDRSVGTEGCAVWESAAILIYLCEKHGSPLWPADAGARSECMSWIMWQMSGLGPMLGQAMYWKRIRAANGDVDEVAITRYSDEASRLIGVLENRLKSQPYLCGESYTLADLACFCYANSHWWAGIDMQEMHHVRTWLDRIGARPATQQGLLVPTGVRSGMNADQKLQQAVEENARKNGRKYFGWPDLLEVMVTNKGNLQFAGQPSDLPIGPAGRL
jgi:GST-like protein